MARLKNSVRAPGAPLKKIPLRVAEAIALYERLYRPGAPPVAALDRHQLTIYLEGFSVKETDAYYDGLIAVRSAWATEWHKVADAADDADEILPDPGLDWSF